MLISSFPRRREFHGFEFAPLKKVRAGRLFITARLCVQQLSSSVFCSLSCAMSSSSSNNNSSTPLPPLFLQAVELSFFMLAACSHFCCDQDGHGQLTRWDQD